MFEGILCITVSYPILSDAMWEVLADAAYRMIRERKGRLPFRGEGYEGVVETTFQYVVLGHTAGIQFDASVEYGNVSSEVSFLIPSHYLRRRSIYASAPSCN